VSNTTCGREAGPGSLRRWAPWLGLLLLAAALHLAVLGERSYHHDESIHAKLSWDLVHRGAYRYDPTYHGPLLYYLTAATFLTLGESDFLARLPVAAAGILMVLVAWSLRRRLGERAAWWTGLLWTLSPLFLFYGRFLRMDVLEAALASAAGVAWLGILRHRRGAWWWFGLWTGLAFATKENAYVTTALAGFSAGVVALVFGLRERLREAWAWTRARRVGVLTAVSVFVVVTVPLYTVGFSRAGDWAFPVKAIGYWWKQHSIERVGGPWWYHLPRLGIYEFLPIGAALVWAWRRRGRMRPLEVFLLSFGLASVGLYCYLGEKTPWLGVHQVWAFIPLAGLQLARTFGPRGSRWGRVVAAVALAATAVVSVTASFVLDEITPEARRVEALIFVQTCPELRAVAREGLELAGEGGAGARISVSGQAVWPLLWYWRDLGVWWSRPRPGMKPDLVVCDPGDEGDIRKDLVPGWERQRIPLRAWWLMYQDLPSPVEALRYLVTRVPWSPIGSTDVVVLRRTGETEPSVEAEPPASLARGLRVVGARIVGRGLLGEPRGVALSGGRLAVADAAFDRVLLMDADGGDAGPVAGIALVQPEGVAWTPEGKLVVADTWQHRVVVVSPRGGKAEELPVPEGGWYGPRGVAVGPDGAIVVSDTGNKRLVVYPAGGGGPSVLGRGGSGPAELDEPVGVAWRDAGSVIVCDTGNRRLQVLSTGGGVLETVELPEAWTDYYSRPQIAVLGPRDWVVTDTPGERLWRVRDGAVSSLPLHDEGIRPTGVAWDPATRTLVIGDLSGRVWVLEVIHV